MVTHTASRPDLSGFLTFVIIPALFMLALLLPADDRPERAQGCIWDRDTLYMEAKGLGSLTEVITGRFDRLPPLYYEMRLDRITTQRELKPTTLELGDYDDAAVACDRLGRGDEAIEWMGRKAEAIEEAKSRGNDTGEHEYRYLANLGTFYAHEWLRSGATRSDLSGLERARDLIAEAIEFNPDAHFGRERYQLLAIEWLLDPPEGTSSYGGYPTIFARFYESFDFRGEVYELNQLARSGYDDAPTGLAGLIVLGNAWESPDIFRALAFALSDEGDSALGYLAELRVEELRSDGKNTLHPAFAGESHVDDNWSSWSVSTDYVKAQIESYFPRARQEADRLRFARNDYVIARLNQGEHPDTHPNFWDEWKEPSRPPAFPGRLTHLQSVLLKSATIVLGLALIAWLIRARRHHRFPFRIRRLDLPLPT